MTCVVDEYVQQLVACQKLINKLADAGKLSYVQLHGCDVALSEGVIDFLRSTACKMLLLQLRR